MFILLIGLLFGQEQQLGYKVIQFGPMNFVINQDYLFQDVKWQSKKGEADCQEVKVWLVRERALITHVMDCPYTNQKTMLYFGIVNITRKKTKNGIGLPSITYLSGESSLVPYPN
jgi:hypothetical protein